MADHKINILIGVKQTGQRIINGMLKKLGAGFKNLAAMAKRASLAIAGALAGSAAVVGRFFIKAAADAEEAEAKFEAVFKEMANDARAWSEDFAKSTNRSALEMREYMSTLQDTFVPMGFARDKATELSKEITKLGIDLASFNNKAEPEVIKDLQSALVGNTETMRKYGIAITETDLKMESVRAGMSRTGKDLTQLQKIQARLNLITRGSADAHGDAAKTAGSFTNRMRGLLATFKDFRVEVGAQIIQGAGLAEVVSNLSNRIRDFVKRIKETKAVQNWASAARKSIEGVAKGLEAIFAGGEKKELAIAAFKDIGDNFMRVVRDGLISSAQMIGKLIGRGVSEGFKFGFGATVETSKARGALIREKIGKGDILGAGKEVLSTAFRTKTKDLESKVSEMRKAELQAQGISFGALGEGSVKVLSELGEKLDTLDQSVNGLKQK